MVFFLIGSRIGCEDEAFVTQKDLRILLRQFRKSIPESRDCEECSTVTAKKESVPNPLYSSQSLKFVSNWDTLG